MRTVTGVPSWVKLLRIAARTCSTATCRSKSRAMTRSPSRLKQRILMSTKLRRWQPLNFFQIARPGNRGCPQYLVAHIGAKTRLFPRFGIFPGRDSSLRMAQRDDVAADFRVVGTIAADAGDVLVDRHFSE